ncbi:8-amino-7-oxononanoate synthase [Streptomyces rimosus subsp. rimosus]
MAACHASVEHLKTSTAERDALQSKTAHLRTALEGAGIEVMPCSTTHVLPVLVGDAELCERIGGRRLLDLHGIYLQPINSPTVPVGTSDSASTSRRITPTRTSPTWSAPWTGLTSFGLHRRTA